MTGMVAGAARVFQSLLQLLATILLIKVAIGNRNKLEVNNFSWKLNTDASLLQTDCRQFVV